MLTDVGMDVAIFSSGARLSPRGHGWPGIGQNRSERPILQLMRLGSERWYGRVETDARGVEYLYLSNAERPEDSMRARLPFSWRDLTTDQLAALARDPELRLWTDEYGIQWRVAPVGPGTPYEFPLRERYLVFDSTETWAGITLFPEGRLGELGTEQLRELRDSAADFGGGRRSFRPPAPGPGLRSTDSTSH